MKISQELVQALGNGFMYDPNREKILLVGSSKMIKTGMNNGFVKKGRKYPRGQEGY